MYFSKLVSASFLALFSAGVVADLHTSCTCHNGDAYDWQMTTQACNYYRSRGYENGLVHYDTPSGRCTGDSDGQLLMGDQWEEACKYINNSDAVKGWC